MPKRDSYHREDLRSDLIRGGLEFIAANGYETLSVRALAQHVGVSPGAPYHHFPHRRALLLAVAIDGFAKLNAAADAIVAAPAAPVSKLSRLAGSFLTFQTENPRLFDLMFESELIRPRIEPTIAEAQRRGFLNLSTAMQDVTPDLPEGVVHARVIAFWSTIYGFATLSGKNMLDAYAGDVSPSAVRAAVINHAVGPMTYVEDTSV